jgi:hypothetical protein|tara:strand:+ start:55 stop:297 length:243 start_codon:yes stop_codon:yes gene_type:complete
VVVAVRLFPEVENTSTVLEEVEAVVLSTHFAVHVPVRSDFVMFAESSVVLVESSSPHPECRKILKNRRKMYLIIICSQKL